MIILKYYITERVLFEDVFKRKLPNKKAVEIVIGKLMKHYKLGKPVIYFTSGHRHSNACQWSITINMDAGNDFGTVCHEVAHVYQIIYLTNNSLSEKNSWHNHDHRKTMKKMINYCKRKNWFEAELTRRLSPKEPKPLPTQLETKQNELIKMQLKIIKYEKQITRCQRKLAKLQKSYRLKNNRLTSNVILERPILEDLKQ